MRRAALLAILGCLFIGAVTSQQVFAYETTAQQVMTSITVDELSGLIRSMSSDGVTLLRQDLSDSDHPLLEIQYASGRHDGITLYNKQRKVSYGSSGIVTADRTSFSTLVLQTGFSVHVKPLASAINDWNTSMIFGRAYLDNVSDPMLDAWLYLDGGITVDAIKAFVKHFGTVTDEFYSKFVQGK